MSLLLAIDQGTTGSTALLFDRDARPVARGYREIPQHYPRPGWVEHDPHDLLDATRAAVDEALARAGRRAGRIAAVGLTNQRETTLLWDARTGAPLHRAIVWQCRRTADLCARLKAEGWEPTFRRRTGLPLDPYFSGTKLRWLLDHVRGARRRAAAGRLCFGTVDSWLLWHLSAERTHATDFTNASRTLLFDLERRAWDPELLAALEVPPELLPEARPSRGVFGTTRAWGRLPAGIPIAGIAGDQQAALVGQAVFSAGGAKNTYGTGCFLLVHTGERLVRSRAGLLTTLAVGRGGRPAYALEGSVFIAGAAVQWLRDGLRVIDDAAETQALAESVPDAGGVVVVPAFVGLGAPYWDAEARGAVLGLTRGSGRAELVRATLESIAFQTADVLAAAARDLGRPLRTLKVDGGASANDFLMQFQADVLGARLQRPACLDTTALGAAFLAGLEIGFWKDEREIEQRRHGDAEFRPAWPPARRRAALACWHDAVARVRTGGAQRTTRASHSGPRPSGTGTVGSR